jgi:hypothetical protein
MVSRTCSGRGREGKERECVHACPQRDICGSGEEEEGETKTEGCNALYKSREEACMKEGRKSYMKEGRTVYEGKEEGKRL